MPAAFAAVIPWLMENGLMLGTIGAFAVSKYLGVDKEEVAADREQMINEARVRAKRKIRYKLEDEAEMREPLEAEAGALMDQMGTFALQQQIGAGFDYESPELAASMMFPADMSGMADEGMAPELSIAESPEVQAILKMQGTDAMSNKLIQSALASGRPSTSLESLGFLV